MEKPMKTPKILHTDSLAELAQFWDTHDVTDFEGELEEVAEPAFELRTVILLDLESSEAETVRKIANAKGVNDAELIRGWIREKIHAN